MGESAKRGISKHTHQILVHIVSSVCVYGTISTHITVAATAKFRALILLRKTRSTHGKFHMQRIVSALELWVCLCHIWNHPNSVFAPVVCRMLCAHECVCVHGVKKTNFTRTLLYHLPPTRCMFVSPCCTFRWGAAGCTQICTHLCCHAGVRAWLKCRVWSRVRV